MDINFDKFASFISLMSRISNYTFSHNECRDVLNRIHEMDENTHKPAVPVYADYQTVDRLLMLINESTQKIEAIKAYRTLTGLGLKESKDAVEKYWSNLKSEVKFDQLGYRIDKL